MLRSSRDETNARPRGKEDTQKGTYDDGFDLYPQRPPTRAAQLGTQRLRYHPDNDRSRSGTNRCKWEYYGSEHDVRHEHFWRRDRPHGCEWYGRDGSRHDGGCRRTL